MKINNAPGKNTKDWLTCVESIILWKKPKSGTRGHNVLFTGQEENDFSFSCFPAAQRIDLILIVTWLFYRNMRWIKCLQTIAISYYCTSKCSFRLLLLRKLNDFKLKFQPDYLLKAQTAREKTPYVHILTIILETCR